MIWFNATFKVADHGGDLETKPKKYQRILIQALASRLARIKVKESPYRDDLIEMIRSIEVKEGKAE